MAVMIQRQPEARSNTYHLKRPAEYLAIDVDLEHARVAMAGSLTFAGVEEDVRWRALGVLNQTMRLLDNCAALLRLSYDAPFPGQIVWHVDMPVFRHLAYDRLNEPLADGRRLGYVQEYRHEERIPGRFPSFTFREDHTGLSLSGGRIPPYRTRLSRLGDAFEPQERFVARLETEAITQDVWGNSWGMSQLQLGQKIKIDEHCAWPPIDLYGRRDQILFLDQFAQELKDTIWATCTGGIFVMDRSVHPAPPEVVHVS